MEFFPAVPAGQCPGDSGKLQFCLIARRAMSHPGHPSPIDRMTSQQLSEIVEVLHPDLADPLLERRGDVNRHGERQPRRRAPGSTVDRDEYEVEPPVGLRHDLDAPGPRHNGDASFAREIDRPEPVEAESSAHAGIDMRGSQPATDEYRIGDRVPHDDRGKSVVACEYEGAVVHADTVRAGHDNDAAAGRRGGPMLVE